jgi:hypothetical protein
MDLLDDQKLPKVLIVFLDEAGGHEDDDEDSGTAFKQTFEIDSLVV